MGKTVQALAFLATTAAYPAIIVAPPHLIRNWQSEIARFINPDGRLRVHVIKGLKPYPLPDADIYIQPLLPINEKQAQKRSYSVTNEKIDEINSYLLGIAEKREIWYLDMTDEFKLGDGAFTDEAAGNGIRL